MESTPIGGFPQGSTYSYRLSAKVEVEATILAATLPEKSDTVNISGGALLRGLTETSKQIVEKINEALKSSLPGGVQSLKPEEATPEATADRIMKGVGLLFERYLNGRDEEDKSELISRFMGLVQGGVNTGYSDAYEFLGGIGAFQVDGVQAGVEKTKILLDSKLKSFEEELLRKYAPQEPVTNEASTLVSDQMKASTGATLNLVA